MGDRAVSCGPNLVGDLADASSLAPDVSSSRGQRTRFRALRLICRCHSGPFRRAPSVVGKFRSVGHKTSRQGLVMTRLIAMHAKLGCAARLSTRSVDRRAVANARMAAAGDPPVHDTVSPHPDFRHNAS